jgi:hypothetical protein
MAEYFVRCPKCSKTYEVRLTGTVWSMQWKLDHFDWTCSGCKLSGSRESGNRLASTAGSDKQIEWAELIRKKKVDRVGEISTERFSQINRLQCHSIHSRRTRPSWTSRLLAGLKWDRKHVEDMVAIAKRRWPQSISCQRPEQALYYKAEKNAIAEALLRRRHRAQRTMRRSSSWTTNWDRFPWTQWVFIGTVKKIGYQWDKENLYWTRQMSDFTGAVEDASLKQPFGACKGIPCPSSLMSDYVISPSLASMYKKREKWVDVVSSE